MQNQSEGVRSQLPFQTAKRSMLNARKAHIPSSPSSIEEVIAGLDARSYPPLYQDMYAGSVHTDTKGIFN